MADLPTTSAAPAAVVPTTPADNLGAHFGDALDALFAEGSTTPAASDAPADILGTEPDIDMSLTHAIDRAIDTPAKVTSDEPVKKTVPKIPSATKKTAPAAEVKDTTTSSDEVPAGLDEKAGAKWKEIRSEVKAERTAREAAEARSAELEEKLKAFNPEEIEGLRKRTSEQEKELSVVKVEATREFQSSIAEPTKQILDAAKLIATKYELPEARVLAALQETDPDKQSDLLTAVASTLSLRDQTRLFAMGDDLLVLEDRKKLILSNAQESLARITGRRDEQLKAAGAEQKAAYAGALDSVFGTLQQQSDFFSIEGDDVDPTHKKEVAAAIATARGVDFDTLPPQGKAFAAYAGAHFPYLMRVIGGLQAQAEKLEAELTGFRGATPGAGDGGGGAPAGEVDANLGFLDAIDKKLG